MTDYERLYTQYREAKEGMFHAKSKRERAAWMVMYRWATEEIRRYAVTQTVSA